MTSLVEEGRFPLGQEVWEDTRLLFPEEAPVLWKEALTGQEVQNGKTIRIGEILKVLPIALLVADGN